MADNQEQKELTKEQRLEIEENALQALLQMGCKFSVPLKIYPVKVVQSPKTPVSEMH